MTALRRRSLGHPSSSSSLHLKRKEELLFCLYVFNMLFFSEPERNTHDVLKGAAVRNPGRWLHSFPLRTPGCWLTHKQTRCENTFHPSLGSIPGYSLRMHTWGFGEATAFNHVSAKHVLQWALMRLSVTGNSLDLPKSARFSD